MRHSQLKVFTLIELLVVLAILSILFFIVSPNFVASINPERTKNFVLTLQNTLDYLSDKSILEKKVYLFNFDLDERQYHFTVSEEGNPLGKVGDKYLAPVTFPERLVVKSIKVIPGAEVFEGKVTIPFTPNGMLFSFVIVIEEKRDRYFVIAGDSISNRISVLKRGPDELEMF